MLKLPLYLVYVPKVPVDVLGQVTQEGDGALVCNVEGKEQVHHAFAEQGVL